jgi:hypothetical protein
VDGIGAASPPSHETLINSSWCHHKGVFLGLKYVGP